LKSLLLTLIIVFSVSYGEKNYEKIFADDYVDALNFYTENKALMQEVFDKFDVDPQIATSMLFPERIRYSVVKDFFETEFLQAIYTEAGSETVDFSIGDFQMKPSFIERLEAEIEKNPLLLKKYPHIIINAETGVEERTFRVNRLQNTSWQLHYAAAFVDVVNLKFNLSEKNFSEKIEFYASADNSGFHKTKKQIENNLKRNYFPYGKSYKGTQYCYSKVSLYFYKNNFRTLFN